MSKQHSVSERSDIDDWNQVRLADVATKRAENVDPEETDVERNVGLKHIDPNTPTPDWEPITNVTSTKRRFYPGDILFAKLRPNLEKAAQPDFDGVCSTDIFTIEAGEDVNSKYLLYRLSSKPAFDWARRTSAGTRMPRTSWGQFSNFEFKLPPLEEQRRICTILRNVDLKIDVSQRLINKTTRLRKALLQYLFDESRFDDVPFRELRQLGDWGSGSTPSKDNSQYWGGDIPWLSPKDIFQQDTPRIKDTEQRLTEEGAEETNLYPEGSIAVVVRSGVLDRTLPLAKLESRMAVNQDIKMLNPDSINPDYLLYAIEAGSENIRQRGRKQGTTWVDSIATMVLTRHSIPVPDSEYQQKVVEVLKNLDEALTNQKKELHQTKRFKRGLLQDLMTGQIRTADTEIDVIDQVKQDD